LQDAELGLCFYGVLKIQKISIGLLYKSSCDEHLFIMQVPSPLKGEG